MLGNMPPSRTVKHIPHADTANAIPPCETRYAHPAFCKTPSRLNNLIFSKFCVWVIHSAILAILGNLVCRVVGICPQEDVRWITARWIVALVAAQHTYWDFAIRQYPCDAVGRDSLVDEPKLPVPFAVCVPLPFPAIIGAKHLHLRPKMFFWRGCAAKSSVMGVYKLNWLPLDMAALILVSGCNRGIPTASALTLPVRMAQTVFRYPGRVILEIVREISFILGRVRGMILHSNVSLLDLLTPRDASNIAWATPFDYPCILAQMNENRNAFVAELGAP